MNPHLQGRGVFNYNFLFVLGAIIILTLGMGYFFYGLQPSFAREGSVRFQIEKGNSFRVIGAALSRESLVRSISVFKVYALLGGYAQNFKPGIYELSFSMSVPEIVGVLTEGGRDEVTVTIPEGSTIRDAEYILRNDNVLSSNSLRDIDLGRLAAKYQFLNGINSLEGFIFPDTYRFKMHESAEEILDKLLDAWKLKAWPILENRKNWYEALILASILEREIPEFEDRQIVAGILLKRIANKMPLQVDATVSYAKCNGAIRECEDPRVGRNDLDLSSPYNTYRVLSWPPGAISNPGLSAIRAATTPKSSSYFYYLSAAKTGKTIFSKTLEEHNLNKAKYL